MIKNSHTYIEISREKHNQRYLIPKYIQFLTFNKEDNSLKFVKIKLKNNFSFAQSEEYALTIMNIPKVVSNDIVHID